MDRPPLLEGGAAARCAVALLDGLSRSGVSCTVLCPEEEGATPSLPAGVLLESVRVEPGRAADIRRDRLLRPLGRLTRGPFAERLRELAAEADVVHFVEAEAAAAINLVDRPALAQLHCLTRRDPRVWNPLQQRGRESIELLRGELRARRRAHWLLVNSAEVAGALARSHRATDVTVAPLALEPSHYLPPAELRSELVGLIGWAYWAPTKQAVERLLQSVWPAVIARRPGARLVLAGKDMVRSQFAHVPEPPGVEWRGFVPSATGFLRELGVMLYPLTRGSGTKIKVLEAMALGMPVITTPEGAEGVAANAGVTVQSGDARLVEATLALLEDPAARAAAGAAAHETFMRDHTPVVAARPVVELYERMLA